MGDLRCDLDARGTRSGDRERNLAAALVRIRLVRGFLRLEDHVLAYPFGVVDCRERERVALELVVSEVARCGTESEDEVVEVQVAGGRGYAPRVLVHRMDGSFQEAVASCGSQHAMGESDVVPAQRTRGDLG